MLSFTELLTAAKSDGANLSLDIDAGWMQGRTTYGGLSAAICLEAANRAFPDLPPLRSANVAFIGPAGGQVEASARLLRRGKSVAFVEADIMSEGGLATRCIFAFGEPRESIFDQTFTPPPAMPMPDECEVFIPQGAGANFANHFDTRLAKGARPATNSEHFDHYIWVRHTDRDADSVVSLLALADMPPPAVMPMFPRFKPISSITWHLNLLVAAPKTQDGWWLLQSRGENAREGYSSQDMIVWNLDGEMAIAGRQSVAIFL